MPFSDHLSTTACYWQEQNSLWWGNTSLPPTNTVIFKFNRKKATKQIGGKNSENKVPSWCCWGASSPKRIPESCYFSPWACKGNSSPEVGRISHQKALALKSSEFRFCTGRCEAQNPRKKCQHNTVFHQRPNCKLWFVRLSLNWQHNYTYSICCFSPVPNDRQLQRSFAHVPQFSQDQQAPQFSKHPYRDSIAISLQDHQTTRQVYLFFYYYILEDYSRLN